MVSRKIREEGGSRTGSKGLREMGVSLRKDSWWRRALFSRGGINLRDLRTTLHDWHFEKLPDAFDGIRILHISDLHLDVAEGITDRIVSKMAHLDYDFCAITGDFRDQMGKSRDKIVRQGIDAIAEAGAGRVFFVLGNHDNPEVEQWATEAGMISLINRRIDLARGEGKIALCGIGDSIRHRNHDFGKIGKLPHDTVSVLLAHSPDLAEEASDAGFDFMMAGHTHGGQICLPGGVPIFTGCAHRSLSSGRWRRGRVRGYTSRGVGGSLLAVRVNCPPEIAIHRLSCGKCGDLQ
jgi:predicted MPP superfamily phosphohydrolase